ncbi:hypothetical protein MRX96_022069 [Rhipicephalus microplus]
MSSAFSLPNLTPPHIMVQLFIWAACISSVACLVHPFHHLPAGGMQCHQHHLVTLAGTKVVGCKSVCNNGQAGPESRNGQQCLTVAYGAVNHMHPDVNYTCELGKCVQDKCDPFDLLIGCWKPSRTSTGLLPFVINVQL